MNYVLFCDKTETKAYKDMFKNAADSNLLSAETVFNDEAIDKVITEYNPHGIIIAFSDTDIEKTIESIKYAREMCDDMRIIFICPDLDKERTNEVKKYTSDVITRAITSEDFVYIINNRLTDYDIGILNGKSVQKAQKSHIRFALNKKVLIIIIAIISVAFIIFGIIYKAATEQSNQSSSEDETTEASNSETESEIESESVTFPTEKDTEIETESGTSIMGVLPTSSTSPTTEKATKKATEKPTEKQTKPTATKPKATDPPQSQVQSQESAQQQAPQQTPAVQPQTDPVYIPPATQPQYIPTSPPIVDDGRIYLDPTDITLRLGETIDIYVSGLSAANGCNWDIQNASIVDFVSGDTTKVTIKAKGIGVTIITATSKSSGYSVQCKVTVKR